MSLLDRLGQRLGQLVDDMAAPDGVRDDLDRGRQALEQGDPAAAESHLERVTRAAPDYDRAWYLLGLSQLRQDRAAEAVQSLQRARELDADFAVLLALAEAQRAAGDAPAAIRSYREALDCRPRQQMLDRVYGGLGEIYLAQGDTERALRELRKAVAVSEGRDLRLLGQLGLAQQRLGQRELARASLSRAAAAVPADGEVLLALGAVLLELNQPEEARLAALRLLQEHDSDADARRLLGVALLRQGDARAAHDQLLRALELWPQSGETHRALAELHQRAQDQAAAQRHLEAALRAQEPPLDLLAVRRRLVALLLEQGPEDEPAPAQPARDARPGTQQEGRTALETQARALLEQQPDDPLGLAGLAAALAQRDPGEARELARRSLARGESYAGFLSQALTHRDAPEELESALHAALRERADGRRARELLEQHYDLLAGDPQAEPAGLELHPALARTHALLSRHTRLAEASREVAQIQQTYDQPLLVVVMGEFNSGKSTFVNALIGETVAPMGVTPTTATINVLKYGSEQRARVVRRDQSEQELGWDQVGPFLRGLSTEEAEQIELVELLYPAEELQRVNVVDTPGLNSMVDAHERTARRYMSHADAVIWLFSAGQAGKQTEEQALQQLREHRLKTVGVLNKADRLDDEQLDQVLAHLRQELGHLVELVIPVAARAALKALGGEGDAAALEASRFPHLRRVLEEQLFARSRRIKREVCQRRLELVLSRVRAGCADDLARADQRIAELDRQREQLQRQGDERRWLEREAGLLRREAQALYQQGAAEVLDFVRPRRWALGEHRATRADRDYLRDLLLDGMDQLALASEQRMGSLLDQLLAQAAPTGATQPVAGAGPGPDRRPVELLVQQRRTVLGQQVYGRYRAFARGFLLGGRVEHFFDARLPRLELSPPAIEQALSADRVDLDAELLGPLEEWFRHTVRAMVQELGRQRVDAALWRLQRDRTLFAPVCRLQHLLRQGPPAPPPTGSEERSGSDGGPGAATSTPAHCEEPEA